VIEFVAGVGLLCLLLAGLGAIAEALDSDEARDARNRNHVSRPR
jgi:hypothetical protein